MVASKAKTQPVVSFARKVGRMALIIFSAIVVIMLLFVAGFFLISRGTLPPITDESGRTVEGSISEKIRVNINGVEQGMFIRGENLENPILLYIHGGMPEYYLTNKYPTGLEEIFTVVWWEQRGSGLSFSPDIPIETLNVDQLVSDTLELTNYLRERFGKEKIYLMGHSGGSFIGIQAAAQAPDLYHAYIGQAQMSNQHLSEKMAYDYMLQQFKANGNTEMARKLEAAPVSMATDIPREYLLVRDAAMHSLGIGTTRNMRSVITGIFFSSLASPYYTVQEKLNIWRGKARNGVSSMWDEMTSTNLSQKVSELSIPVYFLEGVYDYTCNYDVARQYFEQLQAPVKGFYTFEQSAHSPIFEEPEKAMRIMREDILRGANTLADGK